MLNGEDTLKKLTKEKNKIAKPILSEEQKKMLENKIIEAYEQKDAVDIIYYEGGYSKKITGKITKLDPTRGKIYINNKTYIHFSNILNIL